MENISNLLVHTNDEQKDNFGIITAKEETGNKAEIGENIFCLSMGRKIFELFKNIWFSVFTPLVVAYYFSSSATKFLSTESKEKGEIFSFKSVFDNPVYNIANLLFCASGISGILNLFSFQWNFKKQQAMKKDSFFSKNFFMTSFALAMISAYIYQDFSNKFPDKFFEDVDSSIVTVFNFLALGFNVTNLVFFFTDRRQIDKSNLLNNNNRNQDEIQNQDNISINKY